MLREFFDQPLEEKLKVAKAEEKTYNPSGYTHFHVEKYAMIGNNNISYVLRLSPDVGDLKEFFDITHESTQVCLWFILM